MAFSICDKDNKAFVFIDVEVDDEGIPFLNFNFGTANPSSMDFEKLGYIIAVAKSKTLEIYKLSMEEKGEYRVYLKDDVILDNVENLFFGIDKVRIVELK